MGALLCKQGTLALPPELAKPPPSLPGALDVQRGGRGVCRGQGAFIFFLNYTLSAPFPLHFQESRRWDPARVWLGWKRTRRCRWEWTRCPGARGTGLVPGWLSIGQEMLSSSELIGGNH